MKLKQPQTQRWQLLFESYLKTFTHTICRLQREQPVCRFKAKPLISLRTNETTQTAIFSIENNNALALKTTYTTNFS